MSDSPKQRVLVVCTGNACRSQMAEALWRHEAGDRYEIMSAGTFPAGVHPLAVAVIEELGIDMSGHSSKSVGSLIEQPLDLVITVCDSANELCPVFPRAARRLHWPFADPVGAQGSLEERLVEFRRTRDLIRQKIREFLAAEAADLASHAPA
jgi:arsenate reductase